ncbi:MAG: hypothetical protein WDN48_16600 [Pseudolabrys sp.]
MAIGDEPSKTAIPAIETAKAELAKTELPTVESPSISPATEIVEPAVEPAVAAAIERAIATPAQSPIAPTAGIFKLRPRHKRHALLAASVALAGALGAIIGAVAAGGFADKPPVVVAAPDDRKALELSLSKLAKEVTTLKSNLEAANKAANTQIAKISERVERVDRAASAELITGSISAPQTIPVPTPRPALRVAAVEAQPPALPQRPAVLSDWTIRDTRDGYVYVQGHGDVYQVVPARRCPV